MRNIGCCAFFRWMRTAAIAAFVCAFAPALHVRAQSGATSPGANSQLPPLIRSLKGPELFRAYCASCHGVDAKGNGPAAPALKVKPPDLTLLARRNGGQFPEERVRKIIEGEESPVAHGSREMPVWGPVFHQIEEDVDRGHVRVDNLVKYLESIQSVK